MIRKCGHKSLNGDEGICVVCSVLKQIKQEACLHEHNNLDPLDDNYIICRSCDMRLDNDQGALWFKKLMTEISKLKKFSNPKSSLIVNSPDLTLNELRDANRKMSSDAFKSSKKWKSADWALATMGELGELCNMFKKRSRGENISQEDIEHEFADILIYLTKWADKEGIDLPTVTRRKFNIVANRVKSKSRL